MQVKISHPSLTVVILTFNGETYLSQILEALRTQNYQNKLDVLIIDSGSSDSTLDIIANFPEVQLVQIPNKEFGHGRTRNYAASLVTTDVIAYLTQDAIPSNEYWAAELVAPFTYSERIVAVMGKQIPRRGCFPLLKYEIQRVFEGLGSDLGTTVYEIADADQHNEGLLTAKAFYSDVNSAARRNFLLNTVPYRDVRYAEDQLFGMDLLRAGFLKAYSPSASVEHSNDLTLVEYGQRVFDETLALREIGRDVQKISWQSKLRLTANGILGDSFRILRDSEYGLRRKLYWLAVNPAFHLRKWKFHNLGASFDLLLSGEVSRHSLEGQKKSSQIDVERPEFKDGSRGVC